MVERRVLAAAPSSEWPKGREKAENKLVCGECQSMHTLKDDRTHPRSLDMPRDGSTLLFDRRCICTETS